MSRKSGKRPSKTRQPERGPLTFRCAGCGEEHDLADLSFGADSPDQWDRLTEAERARSELGGETCVIRAESETSRYVRAVLRVPIAATSEEFSWGVWVSLSEKSFAEVEAHWDAAHRVELGPYFGWLCTRVPGYPDSMFLKTSVSQRPVGSRPLVTLEPTDHPLAVHQREGIRQDELQRIVVQELHRP